MLPSPKHILVKCKICKQEKIVETKFNHYCSPQCAHASVVQYWRERWPKRKVDPRAIAQVRKAKKKYYLKNNEK